MNKLLCLLLVLFTFNTINGQSPVTTFPFFEGFENQDFKKSWNIYERGAEGPGWTVRFYDAHSGDSCIVHADGIPIQDGWLVTPPFALSAGNVYTLSFWWKIRHPTDYNEKHNAKISILVSAGSGDPEDGKFVEIWSPASVRQDWNFENTELDLTAYAGKEIYIAFRYQGDGYGWSLDDVSITQITDNDVAVTAVTNPVSGKNLTNQETVTVTVNNYSYNTQNQIPVYLEIDGRLTAAETIDQIAGQSQLNYTFKAKADLSAAKKYTVKAYTALNADPDPDNDAMTVEVTNYGNGIVSSFPYTESFENDNDLFLWTQEKESDKLSWTFRKGDESGLISAPHSGERNAYFYSFSTRGSVKLITPPLNLTTLQAPVVKFWYIQEEYYENLDTLTVYVKNSPAAAWTQLFKSTQAGIDWTQQTLRLPNPSAEYYIAFEGTAGIGNGILIDDVTISNTVDKDIELTAVESPVSGPNLGTETVVVRVKNMGMQTLSDIPVSYNIDGTIVNETIPGPLATFEEISYPFQQKADLSAEKTYSIEVSASLNGDEVSQNNSLSVEVTNYGNRAIMGREPSFTNCDITFVDDGADNPYIASESNQTQTVTFYPAEPGKRVQATFTMFSISDGTILGYEFPGDTLIVYEGNKADEDNRIAAFVGNLNANLPAPVISCAPDGSLTFVFKKISGSVEDGWEAGIACVDPVPYDAGVKRILSPVKGGNAAAAVKILLKNYGGNPITSMDVVYNQVNEHFTGTIPPGETVEYTFNQTIDVSAIKENHTIEACTLLANDGDSGNDRVSITFPYRENITLYGYRLYDEDKKVGYGAVSFGSNDPSTVTTVNAYVDQGNPVSVGEYADGYLYAYSANSSTKAPVNFIRFTKDWQVVSGTPVAQTMASAPLDMAYDYSTNTMFAVTFEQGVSDCESFHQVDMTTGALTYIGIFPSHYFNAITCSKDGQLYGIASSGAFCAINKNTGEVTEISRTGIRPAYLQSMAFDHASGRLFWAMTNAQDGKLYEINPATGAVTDYGTIGGNAEIVALHTPYNGTKITTPASGQSFTVYPNPSDGFITISSLPEHSSVRIVDISGRILQTYQGLSGKVELNLNLQSGIYFIQVDSAGEKTSRKLIIE